MRSVRQTGGHDNKAGWLGGAGLIVDDGHFHLIIYGNKELHPIQKIILGFNERDELDVFKLKAVIDGVEYTSSKEFCEMEFAVIDLQRQLPDDFLIACCQTCEHGNFNPYGDLENEIFCLIDYRPIGKRDVCDIFVSLAAGDMVAVKHDLLYCCDKYGKICDMNTLRR